MQQGDATEDPTECGVFVSDIARGTTDEQLKDRFSAIGPVFDALVVKNKFSGETKGYGFVRFYTKAHVYKALEWKDPPVFQDCVSGKMQTVKITIADPKNCLYVGNIPRNLKESEVAQKIQDLSQFPLRKFKLSVCTDGTSKGFGWATFVDHKSALEALKNLQHSPLEGNFLQVSLAEPKAVDSRALDNVKVLFVKGLGSAVTRESLKSFFGDSVEKVVIPLDTMLGTPLGHAFVHFNTREQAEAALDRFQGQALDGRPLTIEWCLPQGFRGNKPSKTGRNDAVPWPPMVPAHMPPFYSPWQHPYQGYLPAYDMSSGGGRGRGYGRGRGGRGRGSEHYYPEFSYSAPYPSPYLPYDPYSFGNYMPLPQSETGDSYLPPSQYMTTPSSSNYKATTQRESPRYTPY